ncbi:conserved Plasmodium protein, unknown function [Plasmodium chabaudi chabaudi]|uniref:CFAP65-like ninth Ig-like domain-containing protein n=1 Tax=Plasmodium chabaudi chabaudi TaxID=31271 RepID=A0A1C6YFF7_PLACU|nr:conserved Plasmodium protein, unknown function [Plasmodium chabaudi chabaudi]
MENNEKIDSCRIYGLELTPALEFDNYEGGVKMTKKINIKNTTKNIIRFRFFFQSSEYFIYPLQEVENISPGLNKWYPISFLNPLNDFKIISETLNILIDDKDKDKKISIKLIATPLKCDVILPSILNFNEMVIKQKTNEELITKNDGSLYAIVKLFHKNASKDKKLKIKLEPSYFILKPNEKKSVHLTIYSEVPQTYKETISCSIIEIPKQFEKKYKYFQDIDKTNATINPDENEEKCINDIIQSLNQENFQVALIKKKTKINWVSVLPQILILCDQNKEIFNKSIINFGKVTLGQKVTKTILLKNLTNAPIKITAKKQKENKIFTFLNEKFILKEQENVVLIVDGYNPVNQYSEIIQFKACNDYCIELFLICEIINIQLKFSKILYIFENVKLGDNIHEKITIRNDENTDLNVEVLNSGNFIHIKNTKIIVKKNSFYSLNLECNCIYPINIHKRIYFLVHLNKQIFYIDVICNFSVNYKMCPLSMHHIYRYKSLIYDKKGTYDSYYEQNEYIDIWDFPVEFDSYQDTPYEILDEIIGINEKDVFAVPNELEISKFEEKCLTIINKTPIEYTCVWLNSLDSNKSAQSIFSITPIEAQLPPFGCQTFKVKNVKASKEKYIREIYECCVFPSNNKDYTKCNSRTLLAPLFLYVTFFQFKTKYLCETENIIDNLSVFPKNIPFLNIIAEENSYAVAKFENNTDTVQIIDFTPFKNDVDGIRVYPQINYVPKKNFLNVIIFFSPKKMEMNQSEIKIHYLVNGIKKKYISIFVSHEINNVILNKGNSDINLPCVSTETESSRNVSVENMTERNALCLLIKEDSKSIDIHIDEKKEYSKFLENENDFQNEDTDKNNEVSSFINEENKYKFYFFSLAPFEKKNIQVSAFCKYSITESISLLFTYLLYINDADMKNKFTYLKKNMKDYINKNCKKFTINATIIKSSLLLYPKIIESKPIIPGKQFTAKIRIKNEHPVKIHFKTKTEIFQIDNKHVFDEEEIKDAEKNIITKTNENVINACSDKYFYVSFNSSRKGIFVYRFFAIVGEYKSSVDIIINVVMPYFQIIDISDLKTPTSVFWNMASIDKINTHLKDPVSQIEMEYRKDPKIENMKKLFNHFNYIQFNIGNNLLDEITSVDLILYNPLDIPLNIQINTIKHYILPILPPYVKGQEDQLGKILYIDNMFRNSMRCLDSLKINPIQFTIKEKGIQTINLLYKHKYIGFHNMPLIIEVENGKIVPLNLCSLTYHPHIPPIYFMNFKDLKECTFPLNNECITNVDLFNDSELDIFYDIEPPKNFTVLNPKGVIKRKKSTSLFILISELSPSIIKENLIIKSHFKHLQKEIEMDKIQMELKINNTSQNIYKYEYKNINIFNNKCINNIADQNIKTFCSNFIPPYSYIYKKNNLFYVAPSSITILCAPQKSLIERIVIIKNYSYTEDLKFKIINKNTFPRGILKIHPQKGYIKKRETIIVRFTFILGDVLLDIEGNIQIELKYIESCPTVNNENSSIKPIIDDAVETEIEEVYEDTRETLKSKNVDDKICSVSKRNKHKKFDDITFSYAQKIIENIQTLKHAYDNINSSMLQNAIRALYGVDIEDNDGKENMTEIINKGAKQFPKFYFYIHIKIFTCNFEDITKEDNIFENLIKTNIYPQILYFKKYINLPITLEDTSKSYFKRKYLDFDKLEDLNFQNRKEKRIQYKDKIIYDKKDICCNMFSEMFKSIIENHISKCTKQLLNISACSIQTMDEILSENLIDIIKDNKKTDLNSRIEQDYSFLKPTILSHFFSHMFSDVINNFINEEVKFTKKLYW